MKLGLLTSEGRQLREVTFLTTRTARLALSLASVAKSAKGSEEVFM